MARSNPKGRSSGEANPTGEKNFTVFGVDGLKFEEEKELRRRTNRLVRITQKQLGGDERVSPTEQEIGEGLIFIGRVFAEERSQPTCVYVFKGAIQVYSPSGHYRTEAIKLAAAYEAAGEVFEVKFVKPGKVGRPSRGEEEQLEEMEEARGPRELRYS